MSHHTLSKPNQRATMIRKVDPDEKRSILERAVAHLNGPAELLMILCWLLPDKGITRSLRRKVEDQINTNHNLIDDIDEATGEDSEDYKKSA